MGRKLPLRSRGLSAALSEKFADGEWHTLDKATVAVLGRIPLQISIRTFLRRYRRSGCLLQQDEQEWLGARLVVRNALSDLCAEPRKRRGPDAWAEFRLQPGRGPGLLRGERNRAAKLSAAQVLALRARYAAGGVSFTTLAVEFSCSPAAVRQAVRGTTWAHLPGAVPPSMRAATGRDVVTLRDQSVGRVATSPPLHWTAISLLELLSR
jgi:hypothetical protein